MNEQYNEFMAQLAGQPMLAMQIGIYIASYSGVMVSQAVAAERAALIAQFDALANEHGQIDDEQNAIMSMVYREAADKVRGRG